MTPDDEAELHRLCDQLEALDGTLSAASPCREGLTKAALALHWAFLHGFRGEVERLYAALDEPPTPEQRARLARWGIEPEHDAD